ncbi:MSMEG_1061 family FMN-dependent PPOX-type flavoprotein [Piscinibacter sakaiensis]|uniref:MSMEG_1061 family FMN-dependent PPOX-type flavoprotein n=1 Tax=Piscinibacter sakaiensis TaxID=1547922 RepID=UPI0006B42152
MRSPQSLAAHAGPVSDAARRKEADHLHPVYRRWIEAAPYAVLATVGPEGLDASPRGDPAPLVRVVDERTLWLPERRGNNRLDSVGNLVRDPRVALLFLVPGVGEALRVNGRAWVRTDPAVRAACATAEAEPAFVIEVRIERVYFQHERAARRAGLWAAGPRPAVPDAAAMLAALAATPPDGPGTAAPPRPAPGGDGR